MEQKRLNIAEILEDYPDGTKLYSNTFGNVTLKQVDIMDNFPIIIEWNDGHSCAALKNDGRYINVHDAECCLFPSKGMRDWEKMKWKRGDVLCSRLDKSFLAIFDKWNSDDYTSFEAKFFVDDIRKDNCKWAEKVFLNTENYIKAPDKFSIDEYYIRLGLHYGGTLNRETLEIEKDVKPKEPEHKFMPFDRVLVRDNDKDKWTAAIYSDYRADEPYPYVAFGIAFCQCIPYEGNEHLLGTTDNPTEAK